METTAPVETQPAAEIPTTPEWKTPEITRIEIKSTLLGSGQAFDGEIPSIG